MSSTESVSPPPRYSKERWKAFFAQVAIGITAPPYHAFLGLGKGFTFLGSPTARLGYDPEPAIDVLIHVATRGALILPPAIIGFWAGVATGVCTLANSIIEAPYQLVRKEAPQYRPWMHRKLFDIANE